MRRRLLWIGAAVVLVGGAVFFFARGGGPIALPGMEPVRIDDASPAVLDTLTLSRRPVVASLGGTVVRVGEDGRVWVQAHGDAFPVELPEPAEVEVLDRVLVVGRLRSADGRRWIDAHSWALVAGAAR